MINTINNLSINDPQTSVANDNTIKNAKKLHLFDIDDVVSDIAARKDLKLAATMLSKNSLTYNMKGLEDRKLILKVSKAKDSYDLHLDDDASHSPVTLNIPNKAYYTSEIKNFLNSNIVKAAKAIPRKLPLDINGLLKQFMDKAAKDYSEYEIKAGTDGNSATITDKAKPTIKIAMKLEEENNKLKVTLSNREGNANNYSNPHHIFTGIIPNANGNIDDTLQQLIVLFSDGKDKVFIEKTEPQVVDKLEGLKTTTGTGKNAKETQLISCDRNSTVIICTYNGNNGQNPLKFNLVTLDNGGHRITLNDSNQFFVTEFKASDSNEIYEEIKKSLEDASKAAESISSDSIANAFKAIYEPFKKCTDVSDDVINKIIKDENGYVGIEDQSEGCGHNGTKITSSLYNFGFFSHLHLKLENEQVLYEYNLNMKDKSITTTIKTLVNNFISKADEIKKMDGTEGKIVAYTADSILGKIQELQESKGITCANLACSFKNGLNASFTIIKIKEIGDSIAISLISPFTHEEKAALSHPTIIIKKLNGYDQFLKIQSEIKEFLTKATGQKNDNAGKGSGEKTKGTGKL